MEHLLRPPRSVPKFAKNEISRKTTTCSNVIRIQRLFMNKIRTCSTQYVTILRIKCFIQGKMRPFRPQNAVRQCIVGCHSVEKHSHKLNSCVRICRVQRLHNVNIVWILHYNGQENLSDQVRDKSISTVVRPTFGIHVLFLAPPTTPVSSQ